ncbi:hypothetical protein RUM43_003283 [Polyplax serrata]|uniref:Uncharacterized protein n=1 Tax=Polyplax serrata TaxID=468196 RepID=A0AAN8S9D1_POLSC
MNNPRLRSSIPPKIVAKIIQIEVAGSRELKFHGRRIPECIENTGFENFHDYLMSQEQ